MYRLAILAASISLVIAACGGSDGSDSSSTKVNTTPIQITKENGKDIAATGATGIQSVGEAGRDNTTDGRNLLSSGVGLTVDHLSRIVLNKSLDMSRATTSESVPCDSGSGKLSMTDLNNNEAMDSGDSVQASFNDCVIVDESDDTKATIDGSGSLKINKLIANGTRDEINATIDINKLTISTEDEKGYIDGDVTLGFSYENNIAEFSVSGTKVEINDGTEFGLVKNYSMNQTWNESSNYWTQSVNATIASSDIDGQVVISTLTPLAGTGDNYPDLGEIKLEGANGSFVSLNADTGENSTVNMTLFDGSVTVSEIIFWTELED